MHIDYFIKEKLDGAMESIVRTGLTKIEAGDVVVTHGASHAVREILVRAHEAGIKFTVTVVDSRPSSEGAGILSDLCAQGIDCVFTALNGLSYAMKHATKVLVGAAACLSNGVVVSRIGASAVAHAAMEQGVPVYVAAETCKFHERVQFDAFAFNEVGDADSIARVDGVDGVLAAAAHLPNLSVVNLTYDVVPAKCVRSIICEAGEIVPADVPCYLLAH
jgi:translation initiation factor eIF-2B subunit delta